MMDFSPSRQARRMLYWSKHNRAALRFSRFLWPFPIVTPRTPPGLQSIAQNSYRSKALNQTLPYWERRSFAELISTKRAPRFGVRIWTKAYEFPSSSHCPPGGTTLSQFANWQQERLNAFIFFA